MELYIAESNKMVEDVSKKLHGRLTMLLFEFFILPLGVYKRFNLEVHEIVRLIFIIYYYLSYNR